MALTAAQLLNRVTMLETERSGINSEWEIIGRLVVPGRGRIYETHDDENSIRRDFPEKYDSTAVVAAQSLAAALHSGLTNPSTTWFGLLFKQEKLNNDTAASAWLQECQDKIFQTIQESNFNLEVNEFYLDIVTFGSPIMFHEADMDKVKFQFRTAFPREVYFELDFNGDLIGVYRKRQYTAQQLMFKFEKNCPDTIKKQGASPSSANQMHTVIHAVRLNEDNKDADISKTMSAEKRPFEERYVLQTGAVELTEKVVGYYEMPAYVSRWGRMSGSKFGFSPALSSLPDIKTLNRLVSQVLDAAAKVIDPPILTTQRGIIGDIDLSPGGETVVRDLEAMKPFESGARFDVSQLEKASLVTSIRQAFFVEQLELPMNDRMTATEVQVRYEQMQRLLGPALFGIQSEFLDPLIKRSFNMLFRAGKLPEMPAIVKEHMGEFEVEYLGPLARAQKLGAVDALRQLVTVMNEIAPVKPEVVEIVDWNAAIRDAGMRLGVPAKFLKSDEVLAEERKVRDEQQAAAMEAERAKTMAGAMKDGTQAAKNSAEAQEMGGGMMQ